MNRNVICGTIRNRFSKSPVSVTLSSVARHQIETFITTVAVVVAVILPPLTLVAHPRIAPRALARPRPRFLCLYYLYRSNRLLYYSPFMKNN